MATTGETQEARRGTVLKTGHVGLNVTDAETSKRFYRQVFGIEVVLESDEEGRRFVFLGDSERLVLTLWEQSEGHFSGANPGLHHLSFEVSSVEQVREFESRLRAMDVRLLYDGIVPHAEGEDSGGVFFEDPDGIRLEVYSPQGAGGSEAPHGESPSCGFF